MLIGSKMRLFYRPQAIRVSMKAIPAKVISEVIMFFVGEKRFTFGEDMSRTLQEGAKYKFYYCKPGMYEFVMSFEKQDA